MNPNSLSASKFLTFRARNKVLRLLTLQTLVCICAVGSCAAWANIDVDGELTHEYSLQVGEVHEGIVVFTNRGDQITDVKLEQRDYVFYADGRNDFLKPGVTSRSNANWIRFSRARVSVLPQESVSISYTIRVPEDTNLNGTYWSVLMVEPLDDNHPENAEADNKVSVSLNQVMRYAIQFVTHIGSDGRYQLRFIDRRLEKKDGSLLLSLDIENTGECWLAPQMWAEIFNSDGTLAGRFSAARKRLFPGTSVRQQFDLSSLPPGQYKALVVADNEDEHVFGAQYTLEL